jgi:transposase
VGKLELRVPQDRNGSPDLNPIKRVFAKFKTLLRKVRARTYEAISDACGEILKRFPASECAAYLRNAGYA